MSTPPGDFSPSPLTPPSQPPRTAASYPYGDPAATWGTPQAPAGWGGPAPAAQGGDASEARRKAGTALGWAIGAAVAAGLALILGVVALISAFTGGLFGALDGAGFFEPLRGQVSSLSDGSALTGDRLEEAVRRAHSDLYGYEHESITCPDTASVSTSTAVVCTGRLDGFDWTGIVFFEDDQGTFVVLEL